MVTIPQTIFDTYNSIADDFINNNFGVNCILEYPPKETACDNCVYDSINRRSSNRYKTGGPIPFTFGICPWCDGAGFKQIPVSTTIKMRIYWSRKDWVKIGIPVNIPDGAIQTIGFMSDLSKIKQAERVLVNSDISNIMQWEYILLGEPIPHGFKYNRYFLAYWSKA